MHGYATELCLQTEEVLPSTYTTKFYTTFYSKTIVNNFAIKVNDLFSYSHNFGSALFNGSIAYPLVCLRGCVLKIVPIYRTSIWA